ncbi:MAG TPA: hypothetical protein VMB23_10755, partial [Spirochaetia bacterium]|nr:hypothetical protein [Spirochaetia bacterium]
AVPEAPALVQGSGGIVPILKVGVQSVNALGFNLQTGAAGLGYDTTNTNPALNTMAFFDILFVDSRTTQPLMYEVGTSPDVWSAHFKMKNFTARLNTGNTPTGLELVTPTWVAELQGHGFQFGMFTQGGSEIPGGSNSNPVIGLTGANEVLNLNAGTDYILQYGSKATPSPNSVAFYGSAANTSGILYAGYGVPGLFQGYVSALAQGDVASATSGAKAAQGWAFAFNGSATPWGQASEKQSVALTLKADAIQGVRFTNNTTSFSVASANVNEGNTGGFGVSTQVDYWLGKDLLVSPLLAFDGRINDTAASTRSDAFEWETGGGLMVTFSPKKFVKDDWNELSPVAASVGNDKIQKFAYLQALFQYSRATDVDAALKFEAPVGINTFDPNLDTMVEYRVNNVAKTLSAAATTWTLSGRVSYDLLDHSLVPYVRWFANGSDFATVDKTSAVKLRLGAQLALVPGVGLEAAYLSPQILGSGTTARDAGKLELIAVLNSAGPAKTLTPKTMNFTDWKAP